MTRVVVRALLGDRNDRDSVIEEVTQSTALEILARVRAGRILDDRERNKLVCSIARNKCVDWLRSLPREVRDSDRPAPRPDFDETRFPRFTESLAALTRTPSNILGWREIGAFALGAIERLPDSQREPVIFYLLGAMKTTEIAETLGQQRTAVANRVRRGLLWLRDELRRAFPDAGFDAV